MLTQRPHFASFWRGTLSPFEQACLRSFVNGGNPVTLYSYEALQGVPDGVDIADAREIAPEDSASRFLYKGKADLSHFSDYFRYNLSMKTDSIWVDTDLLLVDAFPSDLPSTIVAMESSTMICPAILRLERGDPRLPTLVAATEGKMDRNLVWAETGPKLMTTVFDGEAIMQQAMPPEMFFPIPHQEFWRAFVPDEREWCERATANSIGVHLWNNIVTALGYWKALAPPEGSYLYERFKADNSLDLFTDCYPANVMARMVENYRFRLNGHGLGLGSIVRQAVPSIGRSWRHRFGG